MRHLTKLVMIGAEPITLDMDFAEWAKVMTGPQPYGGVVQLENAAGAPVLVTIANIAYAVAVED